jgi:WD40 repeat protein
LGCCNWGWCGFLGHTDNVSAIAFSPDSKYAVTGGDDHVAKLWDVATGQLVREFSGHKAWVSGIEFSPDGQLLLTGSGDRTVGLGLPLAKNRPQR